AATAAMRGGRVSIQQVAVDAFGNALGESIAGANGQSARTAGGIDPANPYGYQSSTAGITGWQTNGAAGYDNEAYRSDYLARLQSSAQPSASDYATPRQGGMAASPVEVMQPGATGGSSYLPSMYPDSQLVDSWRDRSSGITHNEWDTGADATSTRLPSISVANLPPASAMISMGPQRNFLMEGIAAARADTVGYYNDMIANSDSLLGKAAGVGGRVFANAGYDLAGAVGGLYTLATDANARAQLGEKVAYAATHPMNTIYTASKGVESYVTNTSLSQMLEDGARFAVGGAATAGGGKVVTTAGSLGVEGAIGTARWLAPKAAEMTESLLYRAGGLSYVVEPGPSLGGATSSLVDAEAIALRRIATNNAAGSPAAELRQAYQQARGQIDFAHIEADIDFTRTPAKQVIGGHFSNSPITKIVTGTESVGTNGSMYAQVELQASNGNWYPKTNNGGFSSLTPDTWSLARAKGEMSKAWLNRAAISNTTHVGSSSGINFKFFAPNNNIPLWRGYPEFTP
ncbi:hypothetical protein, partial [Variovorax paradoxus]|uniref:hypothetical protein n=1 Tax=Variovorax paradoxus TaxID=34073 RepID=UPI00277DC8DD